MTFQKALVVLGRISTRSKRSPTSQYTWTCWSLKNLSRLRQVQCIFLDGISLFCTYSLTTISSGQVCPGHCLWHTAILTPPKTESQLLQSSFYHTSQQHTKAIQYYCYHPTCTAPTLPTTTAKKSTTTIRVFPSSHLVWVLELYVQWS